MKCLIAYYSLSGTTEKLATALAVYLEEKGHHVVIERIMPKKEYSALSAYALGCMQASTNKRIELLPMKNDVSKFDMLAVLSPTWAWRAAPPASSFVHSLKNAVKGQKAVAITTHGGNPAKGPEELAGALKERGFAVVSAFAVSGTGKFDPKIFEEKLKV